MKCHTCNAELADAAKFCRSCGANQLIAPARVENPAAEPTPPQTAIPAPAPAALLAPTLPLPVVEQLAAKKSNALAFSLITVAFFGCVGGVAYWGWTQHLLFEEQKAIVANLVAKEEKRIAEAEEQRKKQEEEAQAKAESEAKAKAKAEVEEQAKKEQEEREALDAEIALSKKGNAKKEPVTRPEKSAESNTSKNPKNDTVGVLNWTGLYECSPNLLPNSKFKKAFEDNVAFTTTAGAGSFVKKNNDVTENFTITIRGNKVEIKSEGNLNVDPMNKWFIRTTGTLVGKSITTTGSMYGANGQMVVRETCKFQVSQ